MQSEDLQWVVDTGPDFRSQCLRAGVKHLDAVLITHPHVDHIMGLDDLRRFTFAEDQSIPVHASAETLKALRRVFNYAFSGLNRYAGYLKPDSRAFDGPFLLGSVRVTPLSVRHGRVATHGFLFQQRDGRKVAYISDCKEIPEETMALLMDVDVLIVDALRLREHPSHFNVSEALETARKARARLTYLTHLSHEIGHAKLEAGLPDNVRVAFDGLVLDI